MADITITLPDGSQRSLPQGATATTVAESIGSRLAKAAVAAVVDGEEWDLGRPLPDGATVAIITGDSEEGRHVLRHSTAHVMAQAVTQLFEGAKFSIGPAIENGFYYDFELPGGKTGKLGHYKLMKVAGAYWRGNEKGPMLQRIYGTAWESKAALAEHLHRLEEAEKRDHRKLATELDLLSFPHELGGGLAIWHPKGAIVRKLMEDYSRQRHVTGGYQMVFTPHLTNGQLFQTSGHLDFYKDGMYPPMEMDNGTYYMKPMNCPMHCLVFGSRQRSYRELPMRIYELGTVYRYERAGTLHGLMRIRGFTQDDSHIFCTEDQAQDEIASLLDFVMSVLRAFGFNDFTANLSTKDPNKYVGDDAMWETATEALRAALVKYGLPYKVKEGDAAFYGPKIDIDVRDAIGRTWQLSTIQYDFNMAARFELEYVGADNSRHLPIMLHRALFGSIERFFGVLLEHYAGAFPTWLAPVQARVLPVADAHQAHAAEVVERLTEEGFRVDVVDANDQLGKRIRSAKLEKIPYVLVVGDDDVAAGTLGVNPRGGDVERGVPLDDFIRRMHSEVDAQLAVV
jgi:threonyl-tRNA synthetase